MYSDPILDAFDSTVRRSPSSTLVVSGSQQCSASDLDALAREVEERWLDAVEPQSLVAMTAPNGPGFLASLLALRRRRAAALLLAPSTPAEERRQIATSIGCAMSLEATVAWPTSADDWMIRTLVSDSGREPTVLEDDVAVVKLTSGSTGSPRGIVTPSAALVADDHALSRSMGLKPEERILAAIPMSHSYGLSSVVMPMLMRGSTLVLPQSQAPFAPLDAAALHGVTFFPTTPSYLSALVRKAEPPPLAESVRLVITAGAPLCPEVAGKFRAATGRAVHVFYGASECGGICFDRQGDAGERGLVGEAVEGVRIELRPPQTSSDAGNGDDSVPRPPSANRAAAIADGDPSSGRARCGQVVVHSPAVARRFLDPEDIPECDLTLRDGAFVSNDLATFDGRELRLAGRADDLINVRGKKVNPREVERILAQLSGVDEALVIGVPRRNQPGSLLRAVLASSNGGPTYEQVIVWCRPRLAAHKVPRSIVVVDQIPRTERGKIDRKALERLLPENLPATG